MILAGGKSRSGALEDDGNRGKERHSDRNLPLCHFVLYKSHKDGLIV